MPELLEQLKELNPWIMAVGLNTLLLVVAGVAPKKLLTTAGLVHAWVLGVLIWGTLGWPGYVVVMFYFLVGSSVTKLGMAQKEAEGIAEKRSGTRGPENVWGSAFAGAVCAVGVGLVKAGWVESVIPVSLLLLGYAASFATKLADTTASEVGKAYGKRTYLITTLQPVPRGTEGAVSLEGTLAGIGGAIAIAIVAWGVGLIDIWGIVWCAIAAFIATNIESLIGATWQTKYTWLTNELVNVINTLIGSITAIILAYIGMLA
ncbi:TIGR00297 family protein [Calothrix sp. NIES-3974]|uniref:TIGR00297 family protein n=1 Tax=Calothrix sp. NIES-3974 TaxID=2005462 RepID=UPI000B609228|nr:TIGR00297 family protein [Calothrix sp. NIES-3974]BAZ06798.1 hypothetical protein NIES3974_34600 [Calothrix sp. NIES-3974]